MSTSKTQAVPGDLMEAVVVLHESPGGAEQVKALLRDAERDTGLTADSVVEYGHLHSFNLRAPRPFVEAIARAPVVQEIIQTGAESSAMIPPVGKRKVTLDEARTLTGKSGQRATRKGQR